ncbi:amino acid adenylation domain-containing protein [Bacillus cereus]|uniref:Amino acid adenylation domain-containing protein n=1 Tax=Bacillus cereus TaxID=1396 RepID=A0A9W7UQB4_BACCE|nr:non-ribosomal peptide synthetase [Bacillus cereus]KAA6459459.1 amino acid adenylation domain-containing protein [Bacillus cereus]KAB2502429.1 amino acid adenylation domain-containing protein [Bacillus cereus]
MANFMQLYSILNSKQFEKEKEYWANEVKEGLNLSGFSDAHSDSSSKYSSLSFVFPNNLKADIEKVCGTSSYATFTLIMTGVSYLLSKYNNEKGVSIGIPALKTDEDPLSNVLLYKHNISNIYNFKEFLSGSKDVLMAVYKNRNFPVKEFLRRESGEEKRFSFKTVVGYEPLHGIYNPEVGNEIVFNFMRDSTQLKVCVNYNNQIFQEDFVERIIEQLFLFYQSTLGNLEISLLDVDIFTDKDKNIYQCLNAKKKLLETKNLVQLFEEVVKKYPQHYALKSKTGNLTFSQLNALSNRIAHGLLNFGGGNNRVGIFLDNSLDMVIALLATLKAGCAYVPIDPTYPEERIQYILQDSGVKTILTESDFVLKLPEGAVNVLLVGEIMNNVSYEDDLGLCTSKDDLAYIIYTSGTTGNPKGVMVNHESIANTIQWRIEEYGFTIQDVVIQLFSFAFDGFLTSFFTPLLSGSMTILPTSQEAKDPLILRNYIQQEKVTHFNCVPSLYYAFLGFVEPTSGDSLKSVSLAGEPLTSYIVKESERLLPHVEIVNEYGPTEASVAATFKRNIHSKEPITVGSSITNAEIYIIGYDGKVQVAGAIGEIVIGGKGVARGYLNRDALTKERFVAHPFRPNEIVYCSGDLGRVLANGEIDYLGRMDQQVKIRGYRVELGEIETQLLSHPFVNEAVVVDQENENGEKSLCAYVVPQCMLESDELDEYLKERIPSYMVPSFYMSLDYIPLTPNGKVDRKALPMPTGIISLRQGYVEPVTDLERSLVKIWERVLGITHIGTEDNFFKLGGHSLKAATLIQHLYRDLNLEVSIQKTFEYPTIKEFAKSLRVQEKKIFSNLVPVEKKEVYELSSAQKRLFLIHELDSANTSYNMPGVLRISGELDKSQFASALKQLIQRHESLRTSFEWVEDKLIQRIHPEVQLLITYEEGDEKQKEQIIQSFIKPFDLKKAPLLRVKLVQFGPEEYLLLFDMHHIISDGVSMGVFVKEFSQLYQGEALPSLRLQYKDYSDWQNSFFKSEKFKEQEEYWKKQFLDDVPVLELPTDYPRHSKMGGEGDRISFDLNSTLLGQLRNVATETDTTLYMLLFAAYNVLLHKYTGQEDIVVGSPVAGRSHADLDGIIGMFVNTLPMRNYPNKDKFFKDFLTEVKYSMLNALDNQDYPFEKIVEMKGAHTSINRNPIFDTIFVMLNEESKSLDLHDVTISPVNFKSGTTQFDLAVYISQSDNGLTISIDYGTDVFNEGTIENFKENFKTLLNEIANFPEKKIEELDILSQKEKDTILNIFNSPNDSGNYFNSLNKWLEYQAETNPNQVAIQFDGSSLTFGELNKKANQISRLLIERGVQKNDIVGIFLDRSFEMLTGIMGILKAGAAYLPISSSFPDDRIKFMLEDSCVKIVLTNHNNGIKNSFNGLIIDLSNNIGGEIENLDIQVDPSDLAYVIYTSGSTGHPKGVMIEHKSVINRIQWMHDEYPIGKKDVILQKTPFTFDVSVWELFWWMLSGSQLHLLQPGDEKFPNRIVDEIYEGQVTTMHFVPSMLGSFLFYLENNKEEISKLSSLKWVFVSGEALKKSHINKFYSIMKGFHVSLINLYGPTEATVDVSYFNCENNQTSYCNVPIGKPIRNIQLYILDEKTSLQPIGVKGEICISGVGVARGYLNRDELNKEKFISNPFKEGQVIYRTGDLGRWLEDGNIEYLGRMDNQVKIRGYRMELGEIESFLASIETIKDCVVIDRENDAGDKYLCAYIVGEKNINLTFIREQLSRKIPSYMIPSYFVQLESLPLNANGKADRKALPTPKQTRILSDDTPKEANKREKSLIAIWEENLEIDAINVTDNFFELGGDSLKAIRTVSAINNRMFGNFKVSDLYKYPTIREMARVFDNQEVDSLGISLLEIKEKLSVLKKNVLEQNPLLTNMVQDVYPMSDIELGMTYHSLASPGEAVYHDQFVYQMKDEQFNIDFLHQALAHMTNKHEILRTYFDMENYKEPIQIVLKKSNLDIEYESLVELTPEKQEEYIKLALERDKGLPFSLTKAPLWRMRVYNLGEGFICLTWVFHHAIMDGWSMASFFTELSNTYFRLKIEPSFVPEILKSSYKDYILEQLSLKNNEKLKNYWKNELKGFKTIELPFTQNNVTNEYKLVRKLDANLLAGISEVAKYMQTDLKTISFAAYILALYFSTNERDLTTGLVENNRPISEDSDKILGCFLNTIPVRIMIDQGITLKELVQKVKGKLIELKEFGRISLREIRKLVSLDEAAKGDIFKSIFNFVDFHIYNNVENASSIQEKIFVDSYEKTNTPLDISISTTLDAFEIQATFDERQITQGLVEDVVDYIERILYVMSEDINKTVSRSLILNLSESDYKYTITNNDICNLYDEFKCSDFYNAVSTVLSQQDSSLDLFIMDENEVLPKGIKGEIVVAGISVDMVSSTGLELKDGQFIRHPFEPGEMVYRTGDLGRLLSNKDIEYLGRIDEQIKIRGYQIDPREIKEYILSYPNITEALVMAKKEDGKNDLCAYIVSKHSHKEFIELRNYLLKRVPSYMVPTIYFKIDQIPINLNGEIDENILRLQAEYIVMEQEYVKPETLIEKSLVEIWQEVLGSLRIGITENFFELGGDSISSISLISTINKKMNAKLQFKDIYTHSTIREISKIIEEQRLRNVKTDLLEEEKQALSTLKYDVFREHKELVMEVEDLYSISDIQLSMIYQSMATAGNAVYHDQFVYQIEDLNFEMDILQVALKLMVRKHEILRTSFNLNTFKQPIQLILRDIDLDIKLSDLTNLTRSNQEDYIKKALEQDREFPFVFEKAPLWRMRVYSLDEVNICITWSFHHAIMDGWSVASFFTELSNIYFKLKENKKYKPQLLKGKYKDYILEQLSLKNDKDFPDYWKGELKGYKLLEFPFTQITDGQDYQIVEKIDLNIMERLSRVTKEMKIELKTLSFAAYICSLYYLTGEKDVTVGLVENNRPICEDGDKILGCFLNTLPLRLEINRGITLEELVRNVQAKFLESKKYGRISLREIRNILDDEEGFKGEIFNSIFNFIDFHIYNRSSIKESSSDDLGINNYEKNEFPLEFIFSNTLGDPYIQVKSNESFISKTNLNIFVNQFMVILDKISKISLGEQHKVDWALQSKYFKELVLNSFNDTDRVFNNSFSIQERFKQKVKESPNEIAVEFKDIGLSYKEIDLKSDIIAHILKVEHKVTPNMFIGVLMDRSENMIVTLLGILKAGAAFLPIDSQLPVKRIKYLISDSQVKVIMTENKFTSLLEGFNGVYLFVQDVLSNPVTVKYELRENEYSLEDLAYMIYTSGTTGNPKGVMVTQRNVLNFFDAMNEKLPITSNEAILAVTSMSFDISILELLWTLLRGVRTVIRPSLEVDYDYNQYEHYGITLFQTTPSRLKILLSDPESEGFLRNLKTLLVGGEMLSRSLIKELKSVTEARIINMYGPTETTIWSCTYTIDATDNNFIGKPIANTQVYILDDDFHPVPVGVAGHIYIGGSGVTNGYHNQKGLTNRKFIINPFEKDSIIYNTGDLGLFTEDGNIKFMGRADSQVKLRGYRIELEEIEKTIDSFDDIIQSKVLIKENEIVAYYMKSREFSLQELRDFVMQALPTYMLPSAFLEIESFPLTPNGKIDSMNLTERTIVENCRVDYYTSPQNDMQMELVNLWKEVLVANKIGINDNFFEIGGNSLKAVSVVAQINQKFNATISLITLYHYPTIEMLSQFLSEAEVTLKDGAICLQEGTTDVRPIFLIHPHGGSITHYKDLINNLGYKEKTIFGIQAFGFDTDKEPSSSIKLLVDQYIEEILSIQPEGPYQVAGWSLGGTIAFEITKELEAQGKRVEYLGLLDTHTQYYVNVNQVHLETVIQRIGTKIGLSLEELKKKTKEEKIQLIINQGVKFGYFNGSESVGEIRKKLELMRSHEEIMSRYVLTGKVNVDISLYRVSELAEDLRFLVKEDDWRSFSYGQVIEEKIDGNHENMMYLPYVKKLAHLMKEHLKDIDKKEVLNF